MKDRPIWIVKIGDLYAFSFIAKTGRQRYAARFDDRAYAQMCADALDGRVVRFRRKMR